MYESGPTLYLQDLNLRPFESVFEEKFTREELDNSIKKGNLKNAPGHNGKLGNASRGVLLLYIFGER